METALRCLEQPGGISWAKWSEKRFVLMCVLVLFYVGSSSLWLHLTLSAFVADANDFVVHVPSIPRLFGAETFLRFP